MKKIRKMMFICVALLAAFWMQIPVSAATVENPITAVKKTNVSLKLSAKSLTLTEGSTSLLKTTVKGTKSKVQWSSSSKKVATVNSQGKVTAKKSGKATITAKVNGKTAKCSVTVKKKKESKTLSKTAQHKLYQSTIKKYDKIMKQGARKCGDTGKATYYAYADIDKNGTDELILHYESIQESEHSTNIDSGYGENTWIYTIKNGKVKTVLSNGEYSPWYFHDNFVKVYKNSNLINRGFSHWPSDEIFYRYNNGVLSSKSVLTIVQGDSSWSINGKSTTRQKCISVFNKATNKDTGYSMKRYRG